MCWKASRDLKLHQRVKVQLQFTDTNSLFLISIFDIEIYRQNQVNNLAILCKHQGN